MRARLRFIYQSPDLDDMLCQECAALQDRFIPTQLIIQSGSTSLLVSSSSAPPAQPSLQVSESHLIIHSSESPSELESMLTWRCFLWERAAVRSLRLIPLLLQRGKVRGLVTFLLQTALPPLTLPIPSRAFSDNIPAFRTRVGPEAPHTWGHKIHTCAAPCRVGAPTQ